MQRLIMGVRALFDRRGVESEMEKEMRLHLQMETEENIRRGMSPADARRAAMVAFGGVEKAKEAVRDERGSRLLEILGSDLRFALRGMRARPLFAGAIIGLIALGTGANTAVFSMLHRLVLRPLPFADAGRMVMLSATGAGGQVLVTPSPQLVKAWIARATQVGDIRIATGFSRTLGDTANPTARDLDGAALTPGVMQFVGMRPLLGRDILPSDTVPGAARVAILGYGVWRKYFGERPDVLGQPIVLDGTTHTVVGVAPPGFFVPYTDGKDIFTALEHGARWEVIGKLRPGATKADAERELVSIWKTLGDARTSDDGKQFLAQDDPPRLQTPDWLVIQSNKRLLTILFGAVGLVLLITCANVANLLLSRAWSRQREFGVRAAMGASRWRIAAQLLTESACYSVLGAGLGLLLAVILVRLMAMVKASGLQGLGNVEMNGFVLAWSGGLCVVTGLVFGLAPALLVGDGRIGEVLKASARSSSGSVRAGRLRAGLVVVEVSLSVVLLIGTGMLVRTLRELTRADVGIRPDGLASISLDLRSPTFADSLQRRAILSSILASVRRAPGIAEATYAYALSPGYASITLGLEIEGSARLRVDSVTTGRLNAVSPDYFRLVGITLREGRLFAADERPTSKRLVNEVIVNERFARRYWPSGTPIGARILSGPFASTIIGVVNDVDLPGGSARSLAQPQLYMPIPGAPTFARIVVRSPMAQAALDSMLRRAIRQGNDRAIIGELTPVSEQFRASRVARNFAAELIGVFAFLALALAAIGLYAVMSYSVSQRTREIGIRIALGARPESIARLVLGEGVRMAGAGIIIGAGASVLATRVMQPLLYKVTPGDPAAMVATIAVLAIVALCACAFPARRATRVDPVDLVRAE